MKSSAANAVSYMGTQSIKLRDVYITQGTFGHILLYRHLRRKWWAYAAPITLCAAMSFFDIRFLLVALMMIFIMVPMALLLVYINHGLDPVNRYNIMRKELIADTDGLTLVMDEEYGMKNRIATFGLNEIGNHTTCAHCLLLNLRQSRHRFMAIPLATFANEQQLRSFIDICHRNGTETETQAER